MAKYYHIKDEDGQDYMVEEVEATPVDEDIDSEETHDEEPASLTADEINALKGLAAVAPKLMALVKTNDSDDEEDEDEVHDEDEEEDEGEETHDSDENEEVVDTDEESDKKTAKDSFGSVMKKKKTKDSSKEAREIEIANAWAKRYSEV